jgi:hypothetical protein
VFDQFDLLIAKTVKSYNSVYWINRLLNFTVQRIFETFFLIPEYIGRSDRHASTIRRKKYVDCLLFYTIVTKIVNNLASFREIS